MFTGEQRQRLYEAPMFCGRRHPIWVPLFGNIQSLHAGHWRLEQSVSLIESQEYGTRWLAGKTAKLLDEDDVNNASAAMAEIRTFGGLIEAGFSVQPVAETAKPTPDFIATAQGQSIAFEVAAKHQDQEQDGMQGRVHDAMRDKGPVPEGVEYRQRGADQTTVETFVWVHQPGGRPNSAKPNDSVQANLISRVCAVKGKERQLPSGMAAVLVVDFNDFGGPLIPKTLIDQTAPVIVGRDRFTSGALWYAFYGWQGAPVFDEDECVIMGHDGRFRMVGDSKSKLSAALLVMPRHVVCFENPTATYPLSEEARLHICRIPWFDLKHSVLAWDPCNVERQLELHRRMITRLEARFNDIRWG